MVIMALDHACDCFTVPCIPVDLHRTSPAMFFTQWLPNFCAPVFVFLSGIGAFLYGTRAKSRLALFLLGRGLWLVVLELTLVRFAWFLNTDYRFTMFQVIWVIGWSMVVMAGLVRLPSWGVGVLGALLIGLHNLMDGFPISHWRGGWLWTLLLGGPTFLEPAQGFRVLAIYPLLPWLGIMALGFAMGPVLQMNSVQRRRILLSSGIAFTGGFFVLRWINSYGDPTPWTPGKNSLYTVMSFLNCSKYPPSLAYTLMTLGPAFIALELFHGANIGRGLTNRLVVLGRVPLFYYVLHLLLIHLVALALAALRYGQTRFLFDLLIFEPKNVPANYPISIPLLYLVTLGFVMILYPACASFARLKARSKSAWLSYL